ncbi:hypothetical protein F0267_21370 [Vibrio coralliilyticus]|nr:hypothetical protein [Vibrio coralliilyticus]
MLTITANTFKYRIFLLAIINPTLEHNAALSGKQRRPPYLSHCAVYTKAESNRKCQALGIRLKRFVICVLICAINFGIDAIAGLTGIVRITAREVHAI